MQLATPYFRVDLAAGLAHTLALRVTASAAAATIAASSVRCRLYLLRGAIR
jgi:hypothetical protein